MKRHKLSARKSKRMFTRNAVKTHKKNVPKVTRVPMRGGIRM